MELMEFIKAYLNSNVDDILNNNFINATFNYAYPTSIMMLYDQNVLQAGLKRLLNDYQKDVYLLNQITNLYTKIFDIDSWGDKTQTNIDIQKILVGTLNNVIGNRTDSNNITIGAQTNTSLEGKTSSLSKLGDLTTIDNSEIKKLIGMVANDIGNSFKQLDKDLTSVATQRNAQVTGDNVTNEQLTPSTMTTGSKQDSNTFNKGEQTDTSNSNNTDNTTETITNQKSNILDNFVKLAEVIITPKINQFYNDFVSRYAQTIYTVDF